MRRLAVFAAALSALGAATAPARAADDCPDGDWFCEPAPAPGTEPAPANPETVPGEGAPRARREPPPAFEPPPPPGMSDDRRVRIDVERVQPARPRHRRHYRE